MKTVLEASAASLLIGIGVFALLKIGTPLGAFLFSLGLLSVCVLRQQLFTGQCGFVFEDKIPCRRLGIVLAVNLLAGYGIGILFSLTDNSLVGVAESKVAGWTISPQFFLQSIWCGVIMYLAVATYREGTIWGILLGVPLFILCGFQHCVANAVIMGIAGEFNVALAVCVLGNFVGSLAAWCLTRNNMLQWWHGHRT